MSPNWFPSLSWLRFSLPLYLKHKARQPLKPLSYNDIIWLQSLIVLIALYDKERMRPLKPRKQQNLCKLRYAIDYAFCLLFLPGWCYSKLNIRGAQSYVRRSGLEKYIESMWTSFARRIENCKCIIWYIVKYIYIYTVYSNWTYKWHQITLRNLWLLEYKFIVKNIY